MSFEAFIAEISRLTGNEVSSPEEWRPYYNRGCRPADAVKQRRLAKVIVKNKSFKFSNVGVPFSFESPEGYVDLEAMAIRQAAEIYISALLDGTNEGVIIIRRDGTEVEGVLTLDAPAGENCSCGDPAPSDAGTVVETGGPSVASTADLAGRVGDTASAMEEIRAVMAPEPACFTHAPIRTEPVGVLAHVEERSVLDVAEELDARPVEAPNHAPLPNDVSEQDTAPAGVPVAPEEASGVRLTSAAVEMRKVPRGALVASSDGQREYLYITGVEEDGNHA